MASPSVEKSTTVSKLSDTESIYGALDPVDLKELTAHIFNQCTLELSYGSLSILKKKPSSVSVMCSPSSRFPRPCSERKADTPLALAAVAVLLGYLMVFVLVWFCGTELHLLSQEKALHFSVKI